MIKNLCCFFLVMLFFGCSRQIHPSISTEASANSATTVQFSGYEWTVKDGSHFGPGPNYWSRKNVWVDENGFLHLKITKDSATGKWYCAEVSTQEKFGFGEWQFWVEGKIDKLDKNVVLGLFNYSGNNGFDEMDIEWARWGNKLSPNCNYTVWPAKKGSENFTFLKEVSFKGKNSTHRFTRTEKKVVFKSLQGFTNNGKILASVTCTSPQVSISQLNMPAYINLWLMKGLAPADEKEVEIIIRKFSFVPK